MEKKTQNDFSQKLKQKRKKIDSLDKKLLTLLNQRLRHALEIGKIKKGVGIKIYDPKREKEVLERLKTKNKGPMKDIDLKKIFGMITRVSRSSQSS